MHQDTYNLRRRTGFIALQRTAMDNYLKLEGWINRHSFMYPTGKTASVTVAVHVASSY